MWKREREVMIVAPEMSAMLKPCSVLRESEVVELFKCELVVPRVRSSGQALPARGNKVNRSRETMPNVFPSRNQGSTLKLQHPASSRFVDRAEQMKSTLRQLRWKSQSLTSSAILNIGNDV